LHNHRFQQTEPLSRNVKNITVNSTNNKIKVIKRKAYGYHDLRYFTLKIFQACYN
jgi:transposase